MLSLRELRILQKSSAVQEEIVKRFINTHSLKAKDVRERMAKRGKASELHDYSDRLKKIKDKKIVMEQERKMAQLYDMARNHARMKSQANLDPLIRDVNDKMRKQLISMVKDDVQGGIMFTPAQIAEVIEELDRSYLSGDSDDLYPTVEKKVDKIVKKNITAETSADKIDKMLALNTIKTKDVLTKTLEEKEQKFVMPEI